jgi:hypothetical protein
MKAPSFDDVMVRVTGYLTDETFGYEHWRATQFCAPDVPRRPALLLVFDTEADRDRIQRAISDNLMTPRPS